jgi:hypothetical protein
VFFDTNHDLFKKNIFRPLLQDAEIFESGSSKVMGAKKLSMLVQDSLPIDITISNC